MKIDQEFITHAFNIKESLNTNLSNRGLPYSVYLSPKEGEWLDDWKCYDRPMLEVSINLKTPDHGYYTLNTIDLNSNQCALLTEHFLLKQVVKVAYPNIIKEVQEKLKKTNESILNKVAKTFFYLK